MEQLAQIPDAAVASATGKLLEYGLAGVVIVVLVVATYFLLKSLIACLNASIERQAGLTTIIVEQKAAGEKVADAMEGLTRRIESMERAVERKA